MSWDEAYANRYEEWSAHMTADVPFYVHLACQAKGPLVELAVGNGRVAIPVVQATGRPVIGIDSSPAMLAQARARAAEAGVELDLREGDMGELALDEPAALIYCPFRALLHLPTWADRRRTFERVAASLRPHGRFAWNAFAFDHQIAARLERDLMRYAGTQGIAIAAAVFAGLAFALWIWRKLKVRKWTDIPFEAAIPEDQMFQGFNLSEIHTAQAVAARRDS